MLGFIYWDLAKNIESTLGLGSGWVADWVNGGGANGWLNLFPRYLLVLLVACDIHRDFSKMASDG